MSIFFFSSFSSFFSAPLTLSPSLQNSISFVVIRQDSLEADVNDKWGVHLQGDTKLRQSKNKAKPNQKQAETKQNKSETKQRQS
jgi:hypothetical protein